jgi:outer membrane protein assembly factor BamB
MATIKTITLVVLLFVPLTHTVVSNHLEVMTERTQLTLSIDHVISSANQQNEHPWPMFRHDLKHTARSPYTGPPTPTLAWNLTSRDGIVSSAAIADDGTIYFGVGWNTSLVEDPYVYALYPNGTVKWRFKASDGFFSSPALGPNNTIYICSLDGYLFAIKDEGTQGKLLWKRYLGYSFNLCSPAVGPDGTIHAGSPSFKYFIVNPDGTIKWEYRTDWCIISSPAIDDDGTVYIGSKDHFLYAFIADQQKLKWKFQTGTFFDGHCVDSSPAIGPDGTIYVGTDPYGAAGQTPVPVTTNFWAINPDGSLKWMFETEDGVESSPGIGPDRTVYVGSYDGYLYAIKDNGTEGVLQWKYKTNDAIDGSPTIDADGTIYIASRDATLYALYPDGTLKWTFQAKDGFESSPSIDDKGYLYIGSFDGNFYCIGTGGPDVGIASIDIPTKIPPGTSFSPTATVGNYRSKPEFFNVTCVIETNGERIYEDTISLNLSGGTRVQLEFSPWEISEDIGVPYRITVTSHLLDDENLDNNVLSMDVMTSINNFPFKPTTPVGPNEGRYNNDYTYTTSAIDQDDDPLYYVWDWDDGTNSSWQGPYSSGDTVSATHTWLKQGNYDIRVKAKDIHNQESPWSDPLSVTMPKERQGYPILDRLEQLKVSQPFLYHILQHLFAQLTTI